MKKMILLCVLSLFITDTFARGGGRSGGGSHSVHVHGYTRSNGTYVSPHTRNVRGGYDGGDYSGWSGGESGDFSMKIPDSSKVNNCNGVYQDSPCNSQPVENKTPIVAVEQPKIIEPPQQKVAVLQEDKPKPKRKYNMNPNANLRHCLEIDNPVAFDKCVNR